MTRKIQPIQTISSTSAGQTNNIPPGARILGVKGEADGKPTFDFTIQQRTWDGAASAFAVTSTRYVGTPNGRMVNLWKEWPQQVNWVGTPTALGQFSISVIGGGGVYYTVYYVQGTVTG